ncbi:MAG: nucleoside triphosphate pyrophosphohydrolase [Nitrospinales bacterium]
MNEPAAAFEKLASIVDTLMGDNGCPWDKVQTRESLKPYLVEETYELLEALDRNDPEEIKDELGDLLYQILFHAKMSSLAGEFDITDVIRSISEKMVRRHPHIFDRGKLHTPEQVVTQWDEIKKREKPGRDKESVLNSVPNHLPSLMRAQKLQKKAARHGFDWDRIEDVLKKLDEEVEEFKKAARAANKEELQNEIGDILFVLVNIARFKKIDAEEGLRATNQKFIRRFRHIERQAAKSGRTLKEIPLEELEDYWQEAKGLVDG